MKVAIIGAGPSGLVSAKQALAKGFEIDVYEANAELGGVWHPTTGAVWNNMRTNISKYTCAFSDFPWPQSTHTFPKASEMFSYLTRYATEYKLLDHIHFNTKVTTIGTGSSLQWKVQINDTSNIEYDAVVVSTGIFHTPTLPEIFTSDCAFKGEVLHSKEYKSPEALEGKNVLVVGNSFSGTEIAAEIASVTKVSHLYHNPYWVLPKYISQSSGSHIPLDLLFDTRSPASKEKQSIEEQYNRKNTYLASVCETQQKEGSALKVKDFSLPPKVAISDHYMNMVQENKIVLKQGNIVGITEEGLLKLSNDDETQAFDVVICATGYNAGLEYLSPSILEALRYDGNDKLQPVILYEATLPPKEMLPNMFFVGMYRGPYFAVIEQQAVWACGLLSGEIAYPSDEEYNLGFEREMDIRTQVPRVQFPHGDYVALLDAIGKHTKSTMVSSEVLDKLSDELLSQVVQKGPLTSAHCLLSSDPERALSLLKTLSEYLSNTDADHTRHIRLVEQDMNFTQEPSLVENVTETTVIAGAGGAGAGVDSDVHSGGTNLIGEGDVYHDMHLG